MNDTPLYGAAAHRFRVGAVSYLNTVPLVWGMLHGSQRHVVDLSFSIPSQCAEAVEDGRIHIGLVPVAEIARQGLQIVDGVGIACLGAVRSILLISRVEWPQVRTLAADQSSRTSVELAKVILRERFGAMPDIVCAAPVLASMLAHADAALIIGDPALLIDPDTLPFAWLDLGAEWFNLTGLPMVFAAWAGQRGLPVAQLSAMTVESYRFGQGRLDEIVEQEYRKRGIERDLAERYLKRHIRFEIGPKEHEGLQMFYELAHLAHDYSITSN